MTDDMFLRAQIRSAKLRSVLRKYIVPEINNNRVRPIEINKPGTDMFDDEIAGTIQKLQRAGGGHVVPYIQQTQCTLTVMLLDPSAMELLGPFWTLLSRMANGLWEVEGQGFYDQGQLIVPIA